MCALISMTGAVTRPMTPVVYGRAQSEKRSTIAAILPGDPIITGGLAAGAVTAVSIYSKVILARCGSMRVIQSILTGKDIIFIRLTFNIADLHFLGFLN